MTLKKIFSIFTIIVILFSFCNVAFSDDDEKYNFKGTFGTKTLTISKTNSITGSADVTIARVDGAYKFSYNISLAGIDGTDIFSTRILGPSAPNADNGQLKLTLAFDSNTQATSTKFIGSGSQNIAFNSPSNAFVAQTLIDIASDKSNYANEQFYIVVLTTSGGAQPVTRAQLLYTNSANTPNSGGGTNPNGSSDIPPTVGPISSSDEKSNTTSNDSHSATDNTSSTKSSSDIDTLPTSSTEGLNPGGVETSSTGNNVGTTTGSSKDSSTANSILPTLIVVSLFVLTLVIMS
ncbi:hypothetical protein RB653_006227 [Dictyostelium firmibasis]|uniref:Uncharacterized protein n=1 Tax=Dictyostelium firmibasis TaxID=79012 RepID=A0AAN7UMB9_9MYCE